MRQLELNNNASYDVINGISRQVPVVPQHHHYNPNPDQQELLDLAGRPVRANSNMPYAVNAQDVSQVIQGKKQYQHQRPMTINKTIPYNDTPEIPKSV
jgi:hypothetical protein